jgi:RNA polymerase sigma-70 factor (ECF subfamily)
VELHAETTAARAFEDFDGFFRDAFAEVARAAALVARDVGTGQEVAQEAFFRLYERRDRMASVEHARRFAFRVAINLARSHVRKHVRIRLSGLEPRDREAATTVDAFADVADALGALSGRQRAAVVLVDYVGLDATDAAEILGISPATVRAHLMRGRRALRAALSLPEGEER